MVTITPTSDVSWHERLPGRRAVRVWLYVVALLIVAMVFVGGATRLTGSGLSITEWAPIHGVIPPLTETDWQQEFAKYREIPEYTIVNRGMTLGEFKAIFWWEWAHRLLGRVIGAIFLLPLVFFAATGRIGRGLAPKLVAIFFLGGIQGAVGWWMVASGLSERTDVSEYRLAVHLTLGCVILAYVLWVARGLGDRSLRAPASARSLAAVILAIVFLQIFLGAIVAGLDAGLVSSTWPTMDGAFVPDGLFLEQPWWRNIFENPLTAQFDHRLVAYLLFAVTLIHAILARRSAAATGATVLFAAVLAQAALGVAVIVNAVPIPIALLHQLGAIGVLSLSVLHLRSLGSAEPTERRVIGAVV